VSSSTNHIDDNSCKPTPGLTKRRIVCTPQNSGTAAYAAANNKMTNKTHAITTHQGQDDTAILQFTSPHTATTYTTDTTLLKHQFGCTQRRVIRTQQESSTAVYAAASTATPPKLHAIMKQQTPMANILQSTLYTAPHIATTDLSSWPTQHHHFEENQPVDNMCLVPLEDLTINANYPNSQPNDLHQPATLCDTYKNCSMDTQKRSNMGCLSLTPPPFNNSSYPQPYLPPKITEESLHNLDRSTSHQIPPDHTPLSNTKAVTSFL